MDGIFNDTMEVQRMLKKFFQQGRSKRKAETYAVGTLKP